MGFIIKWQYLCDICELLLTIFRNLHEKCDGHMISVFQYLTVSLSTIPDKIRPLYTVFSPLSPLLLDVNGSPPQYIANIPNSM